MFFKHHTIIIKAKTINSNFVLSSNTQCICSFPSQKYPLTVGLFESVSKVHTLYLVDLSLKTFNDTNSLFFFFFLTFIFKKF